MHSSTIKKMKTSLNEVVNYHLKINDVDYFMNDLIDKKIQHHIGIYAFTNTALRKYVKLSRTKLEIERNLEQMRAMENNLVVKVGLSDSHPLSVDTEKDLQKVIKEMN